MQRRHLDLEIFPATLVDGAAHRDALLQHRVFTRTFLYGCTVHGAVTTTKETSSHLPIPSSVYGFPNTAMTSESTQMRIIDVTGARVDISTFTTVTPTTITTTTTQARTTNAILPMLAGVPDVLSLIAAFVGVVIGVELRRTRELGPAIAAIHWSAYDSDGAVATDWDSE